MCDTFKAKIDEGLAKTHLEQVRQNLQNQLIDDKSIDSHPQNKSSCNLFIYLFFQSKLTLFSIDFVLMQLVFKDFNFQDVLDRGYNFQF